MDKFGINIIQISLKYCCVLIDRSWKETDFKTGSKKNLAADGQAAGSAKGDVGSTSTKKGAAA